MPKLPGGGEECLAITVQRWLELNQQSRFYWTSHSPDVAAISTQDAGDISFLQHNKPVTAANNCERQQWPFCATCTRHVTFSLFTFNRRYYSRFKCGVFSLSAFNCLILKQVFSFSSIYRVTTFDILPVFLCFSYCVIRLFLFIPPCQTSAKLYLINCPFRYIIMQIYRFKIMLNPLG